LQAVVLLEYVYTLLTCDNQNDSDVEGEVSAEIKKFLDFLVEYIDLKAKDTADFLNVLRSFKAFTTSVTEAVRVTYCNWHRVLIVYMYVQINQKGVMELKNLTLPQIRSLFEESQSIWTYSVCLLCTCMLKLCYVCVKLFCIVCERISEQL